MQAHDMQELNSACKSPAATFVGSSGQMRAAERNRAEEDDTFRLSPHY